MISRGCKVHSSSGFAMVLSVIIVAIVAIVGGLFMKRSQIFRSARSLEKAQVFLNIQAATESQRFRQTTAGMFDATLFPNGLDPRTVVAPIPGDPATDMVAFINQNLLAPYNSDPENVRLRRHLDFTCLYQMNPTLGTSPVREPCTMERLHEPKVFRSVISQADPETRAMSKITEEFQLARASINQYSFVVSASNASLNLGRTTFDSAVALYFSPSAISGGASINFKAVTAPGTVFKGQLVTNLPNSASLSYDPGAIASLGSVKFNDSPTSLSNAVSGSYSSLSTSSNTINFLNSSLRTKNQQDLLDYCRCKNAGSPNDCSLNQNRNWDGAAWAGMFGSYEFAAGNLVMKDPQSYIHTSGAIIDDFGSTDSLGAVSCGGVNYNFSSTVFSGAQPDGKALYIPGKVFIREVGGNSTIRLSGAMTLLADTIYIQNSIEKVQPDKNSSLFSAVSSQLADGVNPYTGTLDAQYKLTLTGYPGGGGTTNLDFLQQNHQNIPAANTSVKLQISILNVNASNGFAVAPRYYSANPYGGVPSALGVIDLQGLIMTAQGLATSQKFGSNLSGFNSVKMSPGVALISNPPPGIDFKVDSGLILSMINSTVSRISIGDAILGLK